jgi:ribose transport system permease protein
VATAVARHRLLDDRPDQSKKHFTASSWAVRHIIVFGLIIECVIFSLIGTNFFALSNLKLVLTQVSSIGVIAVPETLLILAGFIDFSVGSLASLVAVTVGLLLQSHGILLACVCGLLAGAFVGALQGVLIMVLKFPTMVVTLGFYGAIAGIALVVANGQVPTNFPTNFAIIGQGQLDVVNIPVPVEICAIAFILGGLFLYRTRWGRHVIAIGSNRQAAYRVGIKVRTLVVGLYVTCGVASALAALILASQLSSAPPILGQGMELSVISAVLLGGVAFTGGSGSLLGVIAAVLFIGVLNNGLLLVGVAAYWQQVSAGIALVLAAGMNALTTLRRRRIRAR